MLNEIFESHREEMEEAYALAQENKVVCDMCGEVKPHKETISSVTRGTVCFSCMQKEGGKWKTGSKE
jgi:formylmethanofuran dehydrogenase subunit E